MNLFRKFMGQFGKFMNGRYGFDQFSQFLILSSFIVSVLGSVFRSNIVVSLAYLPLIYAFYRILSKDINRRMQENRKFLNVFVLWKGKFSNNLRILKGSKTHRYYKCPNCRQTIRVPKGKGRICITCPKCRTEFIKRT